MIRILKIYNMTIRWRTIVLLLLQTRLLQRKKECRTKNIYSVSQLKKIKKKNNKTGIPLFPRLARVVECNIYYIWIYFKSLKSRFDHINIDDDVDNFFFFFFIYIFIIYIYTYLIVYWFLFFLHPLYVHYYPAKTRYLTQPCYYTYDNQLISSPLVFFIFYFEHIYIPPPVLSFFVGDGVSCIFAMSLCGSF